MRPRRRRGRRALIAALITATVLVGGVVAILASTGYGFGSGNGARPPNRPRFQKVVPPMASPGLPIKVYGFRLGKAAPGETPMLGLGIWLIETGDTSEQKNYRLQIVNWGNRIIKALIPKHVAPGGYSIALLVGTPKNGTTATTLSFTVLQPPDFKKASTDDGFADPQKSQVDSTSATANDTSADGENSQEQEPPDKPTVVHSDIRNSTLEDLVVEVGTTVKWIQKDSVPHTTTSGRRGDPDMGKLWDSPILSSGDSFGNTFTEVGTFRYFCRVHPITMNATVTVVEDRSG